MRKFLIFLVCAIVAFAITFLATRGIFKPRTLVEDQSAPFSEERRDAGENPGRSRGIEGGAPPDDEVGDE